MKWFIALNEVDPDGPLAPNNRKYETFARVAVFSALRHAPTLTPHLIYNGQPNGFTRAMQAMGVTVLHHRLSFEDAVAATPGRSDLWKQVAKGAMLRLDLPLLVPGDETVLYTDTDIIFQGDPGGYAFPCSDIAVGPEFQMDNYTDVNTGVMVINLGGARTLFQGLREWTQEHLETVPDYDQGAVRLYCQGNWGRLHPLMNWKPYWGVGANAIVVHYHGPKPDEFSNPGFAPLFDHPVYNSLHSASPEGYRHYLAAWHALHSELLAAFPD